MFSAERAGFEPANGFRPLQTFQVCLFSHSSTFPYFIFCSRLLEHAFQACLSSISACITDIYTIRVLHLQVICARAAILTLSLTSPSLALSLHICNAKLHAFNHICKSFARFFIKTSNSSSSTSLSSSDSLKWGQDNTPIVSASRYTRLNNAPLSIGEAGSDSGRIVSKRQPQPEHSGVRRHQSALERNRQQSFMFEHILDSSEEEVMIILL